MRWMWIALLVLGSAMTVRAETFVYVSMAPEQLIRVYKLEPKDGSLTEVQSLAVKGAPGCLTIDAGGKHVYASLRTVPSLASFQRDAATGKLTPHSSVTLPKNANAAFVTPDPTGRFLVSASYMAGSVVVHRLKDGNILTPATQTVTTAKTAHCIAFGPERSIYVPHVSPNAVFHFRLDGMTGQLTKVGEAKGGTPKAGPRHLARHPKLPMAYTSDESGSSITAYKVTKNGTLEPTQTLSTLPESFKGANTTAEVKVHPSGKSVWVSNRGHESLAGFAIDAEGRLKAIGHAMTEKTPRSFDVSPSGKYVFGAGEGSGKLAVFQVNTETSELKRVQTVEVGKSLTWVMAVGE